MKKLLLIIAALLMPLKAIAEPFPPAPAVGEYHWSDGLRYEYDGAGWPFKSTSWKTKAVSATFTVELPDKEIFYEATGTYSINLDATATLGNGYSFAVKNVGAGTITIDPSGAETINGAATFAMAPNMVAEFITDGTDWEIISGYSGGTIEAGTAQGQMTFWDAALSQWVHTETNELFWDDTSKTLVVDGAMSGTATNPSLSFGDGDTGFYENGDDTLVVSTAGSNAFAWSGASYQGAATGTAQLVNTIPSATTPNIRPRNNDANTGIGSNAADQLSLIAGGAEGMRISPTELTLATSGINQFVVEADGTLASLNTTYETLVTADDDIPNKKYVDDSVGTISTDVLPTIDSTYDIGECSTPLAWSTVYADTYSACGNVQIDKTILHKSGTESTTITTSATTGDLAIRNTGPKVCVGENCMLSDSGTLTTCVGYRCLQNNTGTATTAMGYEAAQSNTGAATTATGYYAAQSNTGGSTTATGHLSAQNNAGANTTATGALSAQNNTGANTTATGYASARANTGTFLTATGRNSGEFNTGGTTTAMGYLSAWYNDAANVTAIGSNAKSDFNEDVGSAQTFDNTDIDIATDQITITAHGFGAIGTIRNLKYTQGTAAITGITTGTIYQLEIIDANTLEFRLANITDAGTGTGHTLTPQYLYANSIALGYDSEPTAANQAMIGNSALTQISTAGGFYNTNASNSNSFAGESSFLNDIVQTTTLDAATGDEVAYQLNYTTNKATSGNDTGLEINMTDTASPGDSYLIDAKVGGASKFSVDNKGGVTYEASLIEAVTNVNAATYDLLTTDRVLHVSYTATGAVTSLTLPTAQCNGTEDNGRTITIKDGGGNATTNNITIDTEGSETIDGAATLVIGINYSSVDLYCYSSNWYIR